MANLEQIVSQKAENDTRWKAQQQSERENTVALQDAGIMQITSSPEAYARYLDMQGDNPAYINPDFPDHEAFAAIAAEVAQSRFHAKGATPGYNRAECELDAQSVSYILCRRFGIERPMPETERLPELYDGWETEDRRHALDTIQDMSKKIGRSIDKNLEADKQRTRTSPRRPGR